MPATTPQNDMHTMRCLEVWGGNQAVDNGVVMAGLDAWLYSRPYRGQATGGDIHYVSSCAAGMVTRVLVADVSGHGEAVADAASRLRGLMRRYVNYIDQTRFVEGLNTEFGALSEAGGFATAVAATYLATTDQFTVCNAGHPRPLWYKSRSRAWSVMSDAGTDRTAPESADGPSNVPLGVAGPTRYDQFSLKLATGDLVVLYTDSLIEARDAAGKQLGQDGLLRIARSLDPSDPAEFVKSLLESVLRHADAPGVTSHDDVTVLVLRPNGLKPRVSPVVMVKVMGRMLGAFVASLRPGGPEFPPTESGTFSLLGKVSRTLRPRARNGRPHSSGR